MHFNELSQDSMNAELDYRREQLFGGARSARPHVRRIRRRRTGRAAHDRLVA